MIEGLIRSQLIADADILAYTNRIYRINAPEGTVTPYIVIEASDRPDESDVLALFDVEINIYDYSENRKPIKDISAKIKNILHFLTLEMPGEYQTVRLYFEGRTTIKGMDSTNVHMNLSFTGRATELLP